MKEPIAGRKKRNLSRDHPKRDAEVLRATKDQPGAKPSIINGLVQRARYSGCRPSMSDMAARLSAMHPAARRSAALSLQSARGNRFLQRLAVQAKLKVGAVDDRYEMEANRIADQVMRMPNPASVQGECQSCSRRVIGSERKECRKMKGILQRAAASSAPNTVPPIVHEVLRLPGLPLDSATRAFMEPRFGQDFSGVRVHTDAKSAKSAQAVNALAYTVGRDVVFGAGQHAPDTGAGRRLMAHELTHVVQQSRGDMTPPVAPGVAHEADAARTATAVVSGGALIQVSAATGVGLARDEDPEIEKALGGLKEQEVPSESGLPAKSAAKDALTPDELIDEHVFGPRVHEEVGDLRKRLANQEARLKTNPKDKALQAEVTEMRARLNALEGRGLDPRAHGANVPGVGSINTRAAIQVVGPDGEIIAIERGSWGPTHHAEGDALTKLRSRLGAQKLPAGTRIMVAGNQVVCGEVCKPDIARFAKDYGVPLENVSTSMRTRPKIVGQGQASGKTTERTGLRGDVPKATVKTEPLFPGGKEPPARAAPPKASSPNPSLIKTPAAEIPSVKQTTESSPSSIRPVAKPEISDTKRISPKVNVIDKKTGRVSISSGGAWKSARNIGTASSIALTVWSAYDTIDGALARIEKAQTGSVRPEVAMAMQAVKKVFPLAEDLWKDEFSSGQYDKLYPDARDWLYYNGIEALMVKDEMLSTMDYYLNIIIRYYERLSSLEIYYGRYRGQAEPLYAEAKRRASVLHEIAEEVLRCVPLMPSDTAQATLFGVYMTFYDAAGDMGQLESLLSGMKFEYGRGYNDARNRRIDAAKVWNYWYPGYAKVAKKHILRYILREH